MRRWFTKLGLTEAEAIRPGSELDGALAAWRAAPEASERLGAATRARIVREATRPERAAAAEPLPALFPAGSRLALAAVLPALVLTVALAALVAPALTSRGSGPVRIQATKVNGEVVFEIANGSRAHRVTRFSRSSTGDAEVVTTRGAFRDRLESGADLVLYRVE